MKKTSLLIVLTILTTITFAQEITGNVKFGMNISNFTGDANDKAKVGFKIGGGLEYSINDVLGLQPSLFVTTKGAKGEVMGIDTKINAVYLELPVMMAARVALDENVNVVFSAGPYFACGVGGKSSLSVGTAKVSYDTFGDDIDMRRFDFGLGLGVGFEIRKVLIGLEGMFGLVNVQEDVTGKNMNFSIVLGYKF